MIPSRSDERVFEFIGKRNLGDPEWVDFQELQDWTATACEKANDPCVDEPLLRYQQLMLD